MSGALLMPGFIDGHTHLDMPFGGTVTSDDWDTGTAAAVAGGTTTLVDFSLQDIDGTLAEAVETWQGKAEGKARIDYGLHVAITQPHRGGQGRDPVAALARRLDDQDLHGLQGHAALHGRRGPLRGDADRARGRRARARARRERRRHRQAPGARRSSAATPIRSWHALDAPRAGRGRGDQPRDPPGRDRRHAAARRPRLLRRRAGGGAPRARARQHDLRRDLPAVLRLRVRRPRAPGLRGRQVRVLAADARPVQPPGAVARAAGRRPADLRLGPLLVQLPRPEGARPRRLHRDPQRPARPRGAPGGAVDRGRARRPHLRAALRRRALDQPGAHARHGRAQGRDRPRQRRRHRGLGPRHDDHRHAVQPPQPPRPHALRGQDADRRAERGLHPRRAGLPRRRGRRRARAAGASSSAPSAARRPRRPCARGTPGARRRR